MFQWKVLHAYFQMLLILADFGAGKTLLLKQLARWLCDPTSRLYTGKTVHYICLAASESVSGKPWKSDSLMDIANKVEFLGTNVNVLSVPDLNVSDSDDLYKIMVKFAADHKNDILIIDEWPIGWDSSQIKKAEAALHSVYTRVSNAVTCVAIRSSDSGSTADPAAVTAITDLKAAMTNIGVCLPDLPHNMRNSGTVVKLTHQLDFNQAQSSVQPGKSLASHTLPGLRPILITVDNVRKVESLKLAVSQAITRLGLSTNHLIEKPVVVITDGGYINTAAKTAVSALIPGTTVYMPEPSDERDAALEKGVAEYFRDPRGLLLTTVASFCGMESDSVISISYGLGDGYLRDIALRTVGQFICIVSESVARSWFSEEVRGQFDEGGHFKSSS